MLEFGGINMENSANYTLEEVVYKYLVDKNHDCAVGNISFENIVQQKRKNADNYSESKVADGFMNSVKTFSTNLMHIVDYLGIKDPFTQCKKQNGGYEFSEEDANFLSELMFKFTRKKADDEDEDSMYEEIQVWNSIRKVINQRNKDKYMKEQKRDAFVEMYIKNSREVFLREVEFLINGFLDFYKRQVGENSEQYEDYKTVLLMNTSYYKLECIRNISDILYNALPLDWEEINMSKVGVLRNDYELMMRDLTGRIMDVVNMQNGRWESNKQKRIKEYEKFISDGKVQSATEHLCRKLQELDPELGLELTWEIMTGDDCSDPKTSSRKQKLLKEAMNALNIEEQQVIASIVNTKK